jgi:3-oxoacyl-[acyl-carrier-protein] synthase-3
MAFFSIDNINVLGISACVPKFKEINMEYNWISVKDRELLIKTTGIEERRVAQNGICTSDMCFEAAKKLIEDLKIDKTEIDVLIFVSQSPDYILPATGIILQDSLGLPKTTMAFDMQLGCSGYLYGLNVLCNLLNGGKLRKGLLLVGDVSTFSQSKQDKSTYPIFGDAGTATLVEYNNLGNTIDFNLQSDGAGYKSIIINDGGLRNPYNSNSDTLDRVEDGIIKSKRHLILDGIEVFNFSIRESPKSSNELLEKIGKTSNDFDFFVFHQANKIMNETIRKKLKLPIEKVPYSLPKFGNTSSASIPLTIVTQLSSSLKNKETSLFLSAFGVGLSWGAASLKVNNLHCSDLIEI